MTLRTIRRNAAAIIAAGFGALALGTIAAPAAGAQQGEPAYRGIISLNPLGIPFNIFSAELEGAVAQGFTLAGNASYTDFGREEPRFSSFELKGRYYPQEVALSGFSMGLGLGVLKYSDAVYPDRAPLPGETPQPERLYHTTPTISISADYNWLLGAQRRFLVGGGVGAKRVLNRGDEPRLDVPRAYPMARFMVGIAF